MHPILSFTVIIFSEPYIKSISQWDRLILATPQCSRDLVLNDRRE
ncbi:unnamed protein product, partial [Leptosia nina]